MGGVDDYEMERCVMYRCTIGTGIRAESLNRVTLNLSADFRLIRRAQGSRMQHTTHILLIRDYINTQPTFQTSYRSLSSPWTLVNWLAGLVLPPKEASANARQFKTV